MKKNLYRVIDKDGQAIVVKAHFYNTCTSTGISTFYIEHESTVIHSPELVATFTSPVSVVERLSVEIPLPAQDGAE